MTEVPGEYVPVPVGLLDDDPGLRPEVNMHISEKAQWALLDNAIDCLEDQGSPEYWESFAKRKGSVT